MSNLAPESPALITSGLVNFAARPTPTAIQRKNELLELSSLVLSVRDEDEQADAVDAASQIKSVEKGIEASRKEIKAPILMAGEAIDTAAKKYLKELTAARVRIETLITEFAMEKRREHELAMELQRAEQEEQAAAIRKQNEEAAAEHQRKLAEAAKANQPAPPPPAPVAEITVFVAPSPPPKMEGASLKIEFDYEVLDLHQLYAWNRLFVKLEEDRQNLKSYINTRGVSHQIPGIRVFETQKTITRAVKSTAVRITN